MLKINGHTNQELDNSSVNMQEANQEPISLVLMHNQNMELGSSNHLIFDDEQQRRSDLKRKFRESESIQSDDESLNQSNVDSGYATDGSEEANVCPSISENDFDLEDLEDIVSYFQPYLKDEECKDQKTDQDFTLDENNNNSNNQDQRRLKKSYQILVDHAKKAKTVYSAPEKNKSNDKCDWKSTPGPGK